MTHTSAIALKGMSCKLGRFQLCPFDLTVPRGSVLGFIGPNGAGKTTTLDLIMGLGRPDGGEIEVLDLHQPRDEVRIKAKTAYVGPDMNFAPWGRVGRALDFVSGFYPDWDDARCERLLRDLDLKRGDRISVLSFGARTKLSLVMALARDAELLLLDEPTRRRVQRLRDTGLAAAWSAHDDDRQRHGVGPGVRIIVHPAQRPFVARRPGCAPAHHHRPRADPDWLGLDLLGADAGPPRLSHAPGRRVAVARRGRLRRFVGSGGSRFGEVRSGGPPVRRIERHMPSFNVNGHREAKTPKQSHKLLYRKAIEFFIHQR